MSLYAIGDIQGCDAELGALLKALDFSPDRDRLWFVGDLVNRGPQSLEVLRRIKSLGESAVTVLGNHDLHLISLVLTGRPKKRSDTLDEILTAPDRDRLIEWLVTRPLMHEEPGVGALVHGGLPPQWTLPQARACAREVEAMLRSDPHSLLDQMYGDEPDRWDPALSGAARLRYITNCFTRLRYVDPQGRLALDEKNAPAKSSRQLRPWFACEDALWRGTRIVFGHWSTLGFFRNRDVTSLDTGCVWGGALTALRLDAADAEPVQVPCAGAASGGD